MDRTHRLAGVLANVCVVAACAGRTVPPATPSPNPLSTETSLEREVAESGPLDATATVIDADTYTALLAHRGAAAPMAARHQAAVVAASLADPAALGVVATLQPGPARVRSNLFIVLRDAVRT